MGFGGFRPASGGYRRAAWTGAALLVALALTAALLTVPVPQAAAAPTTITYEVRGKGNATSLEDFAVRAAQTFADYRGWGLGGSIRFVRVSGGGQFTLWLSAARYLPTFSSGCSTLYSCRVGRNVVINETPFRQATPAWRATGASLRDYQHMVVNHETGHWLGFGHLNCPGNGQPAPVMQQQSKGMQGCRPNAWPTASERSTLSRWRGVPILPPPPPPPPRVAAGAVVKVPAAGQGGTGIPADARAVAVNITITQPLTGGYVTAYPCGTPLPPTSNLNVAAGQTAAAFTLVQPGSDGSICVRSSTSAHLIVDVSGYVPANSTYAPVGPTRLLDSRQRGGRINGPVAVQLPAGATAGSITATATQPTAPGHLTVYPCDAPRPLASTLNFRAGQTVANMALARAGADGRVCLWSSAPTHLVVDLVGIFPAGSGFVSRPPQRLLDTRPGPAPSGITAVSVPGSGAHALNLTITGPRGPGWARAFPCGSAQPATSNINFTAGQTVANALIAAPAPDGRLCIAASSPTHIIVDDSGVIDDVTAVPAARLLDTRRR